MCINENVCNVVMKEGKAMTVVMMTIIIMNGEGRKKGIQ